MNAARRIAFLFVGTAICDRETMQRSSQWMVKVEKSSTIEVCNLCSQVLRRLIGPGFGARKMLFGLV